MKASFKELSKTPVFTFNEVVECIDFDRSRSRLIVCSVAGKFKAFTVEKNGDYYHFSDFGTHLISTQEQWFHSGTRSQKSCLLNMGSLRDLLNLLERETVWSYSAFNPGQCVYPLLCLTSTAWHSLQDIDWCKQWSGGLVKDAGFKRVMSYYSITNLLGWSCHFFLSGNAAFDLNDDWMLVDNLVDGFDLYQYPRTSPSESFHIPREKSYVFGCTFVGGKLVACGSDHGLVYLYSVDTGRVAGKLRHGSRSAMVQVIEVF